MVNHLCHRKIDNFVTFFSGSGTLLKNLCKNEHYENLSLGTNHHSLYPVCGDCRPQDGFLSFEKVTKNKV